MGVCTLGSPVEKGALPVSLGEPDGLNFPSGGCGGGPRGNEVGGNAPPGILGCKRIPSGVRLGTPGLIPGFSIIGPPG